MGLTWQDVDDIGFELAQAHPDEDPGHIELPELLRMVTELDDFEDDPERVDEGTLERIAQAWEDAFARNA
ncbi:MAG TPA: Fe-S cluster assembly protein IscX [Candidatus Eremiobacteraceae bacterium]|jgi:FeS assembly protein IscX|nr:Fe-S cluster assembly protein IscX [Candidatus Eremiobacteraceae bacterium]